MAKRVTWKESAVVSLKLDQSMFTLGQMLHSPYMRFFNVQNETGVWRDLDLSRAEILFCVPVGQVVLQQLCEGKVARDRTAQSFHAFFDMLGEARSRAINFVASDMWRAFFSVVSERNHDA
jgi:hypothetical protein